MTITEARKVLGLNDGDCVTRKGLELVKKERMGYIKQSLNKAGKAEAQRDIKAIELLENPSETDIEKFLNDGYVYGDVQERNGFVMVDIHWGDWKHEHLRAKWLMATLGYTLMDTEVTEEDGSDCYSAIHKFSNVIQ